MLNNLCRNSFRIKTMYLNLLRFVRFLRLKIKKKKLIIMKWKFSDP